MTNRRASHLLALALFALVLAAAAPALAADRINSTRFGGVAIEGYDAVAYHTEGEAVKGEKAHSVEWMDAEWRFASAENRDLFAADPEKYAPQYGGYCAFAVAHGKTAGIDPEAFTLVDGKLYLNYSPHIQREWLADRDRFIRQADENWPAVID